MGWMNFGGSPEAAGGGLAAPIAPPAKGRLLRGLLFGLCCWHAAFLSYSIFPTQAGQDDPGVPAMDLYRLVTGSRQVWNVFQTIPALHSLDARLEGADAAGRRFTAGCLLPGFRPYPQPEESRYYVLFHRLLMTSDGAPFREDYLRKVAQLMRARPGPGADARWSLVADAGFTRTLVHVRRDGQLALPVTHSFSPASAEGAPP